ncbi:MAG: hypothetical protein GXY83_21110 [Rhodopirellula sp.]|nr:hypothetical protein [Rhodopirellula sp.]
MIDPSRSSNSADPRNPAARIPRCRTVLLALVLLAMPAFQIYRYAVFASRQGGIEHDSGWYFGTARNLAERGIYASSTNVALSNEPIGRGTGCHNRPTVQDDEGFTYFPAGVTVGPGFIVPEALVLRLFGVGWWQYRLLPLSAMFCLLALLSALAYVRGGYGAVLLLQLWLWALPPLTFNFAYEAYSEHLALLYSLLAVCAYGYAFAAERQRALWVVAGLLLGLAYLTKSLFLISSAAVVLHVGWSIVGSSATRKKACLGLALIAAGFLLPVMAFEIYRFAVLVNRFGLHGYFANTADYMLVFLSGGSGLGSDLQNRLEVARVKLGILKTIGLKIAVLAWPLATGATVFAFRNPQAAKMSLRSRVVGTVLEVCAVKVMLVLTWFTFLTPSIFTRHAWDALILIILLISIALATALRGLLPWRRRSLLAGLVLLLAVGNLTGFDYASTEVSPRLQYERVLRWYEPFYRPLQSLAFSPVFQRDAQQEVVNFLQREVRDEDRIYYLGRFLVAELPPLTGRVFFLMDRYEWDRRTRDGRAFVILGPYQIGDRPWRIPDEASIDRLLTRYEDKIVFQNECYVVIEGPVAGGD